MKKITLIILLIPVFLQAQIYSKKDIQELVIPASCLFVAGGFDGGAEYLKFHYTQNSTYWNPSISWRNKWKNGDPQQGERFFMSSTAFVGLTDGYHMLRTARNGFMVIGITIRLGEKRKWYKYAIDSAILYTSYNLGFNLLYETLK